MNKINLNLFEKFKDSILAINCTTEEQAKEFVSFCYSQGMEWEKEERNASTTNWEFYEKDTVYFYEEGCKGEGNVLLFGDSNDVEKHQELIKYFDLLVYEEVISNNNILQKKREINEKIQELKQQIEELNMELKIEESKKIQIAKINVKREEFVSFKPFMPKEILNINDNESETKHSVYELIYTKQGNKTICEFSDDATTGVGVAICSEEDKYNYRTGMVLSEVRAKADFYKKIADKYARQQ